MKFVEYNPVLGSGCIVRTFLRLLDKDVSEIKNAGDIVSKEISVHV